MGLAAEVREVVLGGLDQRHRGIRDPDAHPLDRHHGDVDDASYGALRERERGRRDGPRVLQQLGQALGFNGVNVIVDKMSQPYLAGASIDFVDTIEKQGFTIDNPNAGGSCACGDSFH
ncbi:MAG: hypothetical protein QOI16_3999 [Pseudonocardiales bacterium]|nr:hypothetical protein [Pseudonocardiales bacterium]